MSRVVGYTEAFTPSGVRVQVRTMNMALDREAPTREELADGLFETNALWHGTPEAMSTVARYRTALEAVQGHDDAVSAFEGGTLTVATDDVALFKPRGGCGHTAHVYLPLPGATLASVRELVGAAEWCHVCSLLDDDTRALLNDLGCQQDEAPA